MWGIPWPARLWLLQGPEEAVPLYTVASAEATAECAVYGKDTLASEATSVFTYSLAAALSAEATSISDTSEVLVLHFAITVLSEASARERAIGLTELPQVTAELVVSYRLYGELETLLESTVVATEKALGMGELIVTLAESWGLALENRAELETESVTLELGSRLEWQANWADGQLHNVEITPDGCLRIGAAGVNATLVVGENNSFVLYESGALWAWGRNNLGQLGAGDYIDKLVPVLVATDIVEVSAGDAHTLVRKADGTAWACGWDDSGQLGLGLGYTTIPATFQQSKITDVVAVRAGAINSYFIKSDGTVWACGINNFGQCGGTSDLYGAPTKISGITDAVDVAAGNQFALILRRDGSVYGIGLNKYGQLGNGATAETVNSPVRTLISDVVSIACGDYHALALKKDGTVWAWGLNRFGTLGVGQTPLWSEKPLQVPGLANVVKIYAGKTSSFAIDADGRVWAWGLNDYYNLGLGDSQMRFTTTQVNVEAIQVAPGGLHTLFLCKDGKILGVGSNAYGQLGDGTRDSRTTIGITVADAPLERYGTWLSNPVWLASAGSASGGSVSWDATGDVSVKVSVSKDGRITWSDWRSIVNGGTLAELEGGCGYGGAYLRFLVQLRGKDTVLRRLGASVNAGQITLRERQAFVERYISSLVTSESRVSRYMWDILEYVIQSEASLSLKFFEWLAGLADGELFATEKPIGVKELLSALAVSQWGLVDEKVYALVVVLRWYLTAVDRITCTLPCADRVSQLLTAVDGYAYDLAAMGELLQKLQAVERLDYELKVGGRP